MRPVPIASIRTARLLLREPERSDTPEMTALANDWEVAVRLGTMPHPYTEADAELLFTHFHPGRSSWALSLSEGDVFAGIVSLKPEAEDNAAGLGYWLGRRYWGAGYATEAARAVVEYARSLGVLDRFISGYYSDNEASGRVLRKLGFVEEGRSLRYSTLRGEGVDYIDMTLPAWR